MCSHSRLLSGSVMEQKSALLEHTLVVNALGEPLAMHLQPGSGLCRNASAVKGFRLHICTLCSVNCQSSFGLILILHHAYNKCWSLLLGMHGVTADHDCDTVQSAANRVLTYASGHIRWGATLYRRMLHFRDGHHGWSSRLLCL